MMKRHTLNQQGMTLIEIIVCFAIVVVIVLSMFQMVNSYKDKQDIESYKSSITTYRNTLTKVIWNDIIKNDGMIGYQDNSSGDKFEYEFYFRNSTTTVLTINHNALITDDANRIGENSNFSVLYGPSDNQELFDFPDIYNLQFNKPQVNEVKCIDENACLYGKNTTLAGSLFHIHIGAYHPDKQIGDKYTLLDIHTPNVLDYYYALGKYE